ncbi:MAG: hypothetical protein AB1489_37925, partial [Acidobacteriota bacterium]
MNNGTTKLAAFFLFLITSVSLLSVESATVKSGETIKPNPKLLNTGLADVKTFMAFYNRLSTDVDIGNKPLILELGWVRGMSREGKNGRAIAKIDRLTGDISLTVKGMPEGEWDFSLIENRPIQNYSTMPEFGDEIIRIGSINVKRGYGTLNTRVDPALFLGFRIDRATISRAGIEPAESFALTGAPSLTDRLNYLPSFSKATTVQEREAVLEELITKGRDIFLNEVFNGNGRTCATCHREERNFTIDPKFIATLPPTDPLFVAETNPALANNFENSALMRKFGLFIENVDGFEDLTNKFTLRASSSILAVALSIKAPTRTQTIDTTAAFDNSPLQRLGWGGDGAPGSGTLREFAIGAVIQHFPKTLDRKTGVDFRLPTDQELDALEAFQLSLGRSEDYDLMKLKLVNKLASKGQKLFISAVINDGGKSKKCMECHFNGGATVGFDFAKDTKCLTCIPSDANGTFDIGISDLKDAKDQGLPLDGGFGKTKTPDGAFGSCLFNCIKAFNTPTLVEAADTAPFFHNHLIDTIEKAVKFYGTDDFNNSDTGKMEFPPGV